MARFKKSFGNKSASPFTIAAMTAAFNDGDEWLEQVNEYIDGNFDFAVDYIHKNLPWVKVLKPEGTYMLWMDYSGSELEGEEVEHRINNIAHVIGNSGSQYDPKLDGRMQRFCIPVPRDVLRTALENIRNAFCDID